MRVMTLADEGAPMLNHNNCVSKVNTLQFYVKAMTIVLDFGVDCNITIEEIQG